MGYSTDFEGEFVLNRPLEKNHKEYLDKFARTRRMKRNAQIAATLPDPHRQAVGLPIGAEGGYFAGATGLAGQDCDDSIVDYNEEPIEQHSLWCDWQPTEDGTAIHWNGAEKFHNYDDWLRYIIKHFLEPWGYRIAGDVRWQGAFCLSSITS